MPGSDVVQFRLNSDASIAQELWRRENATFGYRYLVWVNFADQAGDAHQMWWRIDATSNLVTDILRTAQGVAEAHAEECGIRVCEWRMLRDA